jgi:hypothetical protein
MVELERRIVFPLVYNWVGIVATDGDDISWKGLFSNEDY